MYQKAVLAILAIMLNMLNIMMSLPLTDMNMTQLLQRDPLPLLKTVALMLSEIMVQVWQLLLKMVWRVLVITKDLMYVLTTVTSKFAVMNGQLQLLFAMTARHVLVQMLIRTFVWQTVYFPLTVKVLMLLQAFPKKV